MQPPDSIGLQTTKVSSRWGCQTQQNVSSSPRGGRNSSALQITQQRKSFQTEEPSVRGQTRRWVCPGRERGPLRGRACGAAALGQAPARALPLGPAVGRHHASFSPCLGEGGATLGCLLPAPLPQLGFSSPLQGTRQAQGSVLAPAGGEAVTPGDTASAHQLSKAAHGQERKIRRGPGAWEQGRAARA